MCKVVIVVALVALLAPSPGSAAVISYTCTFELTVSPPEDGDLAKATKSSKTPMTLRFVVDGSAGKAYILGNLGSAEVDVSMVREGEQVRGLVFVERVPSGTLQVTAIDATSLRSVHSRHTFMRGLFPSQAYGTCEER